MKKVSNKKISSLLLCMMLIVAMAFTALGCGEKNPSENDGKENQTIEKVLGEGSVKILFTVVEADGTETTFEIHTDKETVGDALLEHALIAGEESAYGLYVKTVNGITADYDTDGTYWAFYVNGEYALTGVDSTSIKEGETYTFKVEK